MGDGDRRILRAGPHYHGIDTVADWVYSEWGHLTPGNSLSATRERLETRLVDALVPSLFIIEADGVPAATASLVDDDLTLRPELGPWVASVYVAPAFRGAGLASTLLERRARVVADPAVVLVQPHDAARQLAVDLKTAAIAAEIFTIDRWGFGHAALVGTLAAHRGGDVITEILSADAC